MLRTAYVHAALLLMLGIACSGCASVPGLQPGEENKVRTITSIGDQAVEVGSGDPGASAVATADPPRELDESRRISGRVVDVEGYPVPNAEVRLAVDGSSTGRSQKVFSDEAGRFSLNDLRGGSTRTLVAEWYDGQGEPWKGRVRVQVPRNRVDIVLAPESPEGRAGVRSVGRGGDPTLPEDSGGDVNLSQLGGDERVNIEDLPLPGEAEELLADDTNSALAGAALNWKRAEAVAQARNAAEGLASSVDPYDSGASAGSQSAADSNTEAPAPSPYAGYNADPSSTGLAGTAGAALSASQSRTLTPPVTPPGIGGGDGQASESEKLIDRAFQGPLDPPVPPLQGEATLAPAETAPSFSKSESPAKPVAEPPSTSGYDSPAMSPATDPANAPYTQEPSFPPLSDRPSPSSDPDALADPSELASTQSETPSPSPSEPSFPGQSGIGGEQTTRGPNRAPSSAVLLDESEPEPDSNNSEITAPDTSEYAQPEKNTTDPAKPAGEPAVPRLAEPSTDGPGFSDPTADLPGPAEPSADMPGLSDPTADLSGPAEPAATETENPPDQLPAPSPLAPGDLDEEATAEPDEGEADTEKATEEPLSDGGGEESASLQPRKTWGEVASVTDTAQSAEAGGSTDPVPGLAATTAAVPASAAVGAAASPSAPAAPMDPSLLKASCRFDAGKKRLVDFQLADTEGRSLRFKDLDADYILIDFWGSWCGPCLRAIPHLIELREAYPLNRLEIVSIAYEEGAYNAQSVKARAVARRLGVNYRVLVGEADGKPCPLRAALNIKAFPTLVLLDRQGNVVWRDQGADPATLERLDRVIAANFQREQTRRR